MAAAQFGEINKGSKDKKSIKEMVILFLITKILAIALPSLRISPLGGIGAIASMYTAALLINVVYIQSIGSGIDIFSGIFNETILSIDSPHI